MNCTQSFYAELLLFEGEISSVSRPELVPDDKCIVCANSLHEMSGISTCCGNYSKPLKCGHWVHINCQLNKVDMHKCLTCEMQLADIDNIEYIIKKYKR